MRNWRTLREHGLGHGPRGDGYYTGRHPWSWRRLVCAIRGHRQTWIRRGDRFAVEFARCGTCKGNYGIGRVVRET